MTFDEVLDQVRELLRNRGRLSYQSLKARFNIDDQFIEGLKGELIKAERVAVDEDGEVLVWIGASPVSGSTFQVPSPQSLAPHTQPPDPGLRISDPGHWTPPHLAERIRAEQAALAARGVTDGERKTITALFADIKDSTALIEDLDPEEARQVIDPALQVMMDAVHRYEGFVTQSLGDGIFALFGAPIAHEDHPQRALYAALRMQEESKRYAERLLREQGINLQIRVGLNTGEVVLRSIRKDDLHTDYLPVGHSTHIAARMESLASGGGIVVSQATHKLTEGYFRFNPLGAAKVKGVTEPIPIYEVLGVGPLRTRLQVAARRGLVRFVGRQDELAQLRRALESARAGHGQIVGVMGDPGVGKSRLFHEFKLLAHQGGLVLETFSVSHGKAYAYLPLIELVKDYFHITSLDDERQRREKVMGKVLALDRSLEDILPYLFALLGVADPSSPLQQRLEDPQVRRRRTFEALKRLFLRESFNQPLLLVFEDLHWLDSETEAFLNFLSDSVATARILLLVNYRPEYHHPWSNKTYYTQLRLDPLGKAEAEELLTALLGEEAELTPLKRLILEKTEGTPFFMEEVVQTLAEEKVLVGERGHYRLAKAPTALQIPPTVQGVLTARIDRLGAEEKSLLQTLSVIGKKFSLSLLRQVVEKPEEELHGVLSHLQAAEFIYEQPSFPDVEYTFKHALTQEVAYNSLLSDRRKGLHERTAQAIEAIYLSRLEDHYGDLAYHYSHSENTEKAVEYLHLAGQQAVQQSAYAEAITHLTTALELLEALSDTPERAKQELTLRIALGPALAVTQGLAASEVIRTYTRARELCQQVGEAFQFFSVLWGLWSIAYGRGELQTARELGEQLLTLAQRQTDPALLLEAHHVQWSTLVYFGEWTSVREHTEQGVALDSPQAPRSHAFSYRWHDDPGMCCRGSEAVALWFLGYPDQALKRSQEALTLAQELSHPYSLAVALYFGAYLHQFRRQGQAAQKLAEALRVLSSEQGFVSLLAWGTMLQGWVLAEQGQAKEGIAQIRQSLITYQAIGSELGRPSILVSLAEVYGQIGEVEEGLNALAEALTAVERTGERWYEAELYRLKGELTLQSKVQSLKSKVEEAEACFHKAIEIARKQSAKSLELRGVTSLARLWQQQGKTTEAHRMLAEIYGWFTEGFDTADLQEAKVLLEELAG
jgi:class 3 adenylate cyclase/predicted ATPase